METRFDSLIRYHIDSPVPPSQQERKQSQVLAPRQRFSVGLSKPVEYWRYTETQTLVVITLLDFIGEPSPPFILRIRKVNLS